MNKKTIKTLYKIGIIVLLAVVVMVILVIKNKMPADSNITGIPIDSGAVVDSIAQQDSLAQISKPDTTAISHDDSLSMLAIPVAPEQTEKKPSLPKNVLAKVNDEAITTATYDSIFNSLPSQAKDYFKDDKADFLEELIIRQLLLQDARKKKIENTPEYKSAISRNPGNKEDAMINALLNAKATMVSLTEDDLKSFFEQYKDQLPNKDYESVKEQLKPMALEEKQRVAIENYINQLKSSAKIVRNETWIKAQEALVADNPLSKALKSGKPVVADFGRGTCVPCKMMEPLLKELQQEFAGKAAILILDVGEYATLSRQYGVRMIPTQIFFDSNGKELHRHEGFMSKENLIAQLKKMGVE